MTKNTVVIPGKGDYFKDNKEGKLVVVFATTRTEVAYAPVGSSAEFRVGFQEFQDGFTYVPAEEALKPAKV